MIDKTDEQLAVLAQNKDRQALEILVARYLKPVYFFVYKYVRNQSDAEDVTQEIFVKVWRYLSKFNSNKSFKSWLYTVAKNTCLDFLKKKKELPFSELLSDDGGNDFFDSLLPDNSPRSDIEIDNKIIAQDLADAVGKLKPKYAEVVNYHHHGDLNFREIAEKTGDSLNTIKSRYRRALLLLKKILVKDKT